MLSAARRYRDTRRAVHRVPEYIPTQSLFVPARRSIKTMLSQNPCPLSRRPVYPPIPSTSHVPPQRASWATQALKSTDPRAPVHRLPVANIDMIQNDYGLVEEREAKELSLELMNERTAVMNEADKDYDNFLVCQGLQPL